MNDMELTEALKRLYTEEDNSSPERVKEKAITEDEDLPF